MALFYMALEESEDGGQVITEGEKPTKEKLLNDSDKNLIVILNRKITALEAENKELKRRIKKYCHSYMAERDNVYNRAAGQERGD